MYIETVPNRNSRPALLLREGWREGKRVHKRTLANLTDWPADKIERLRRVLKDEPLLSPEQVLGIERSVPHGHVQAVLGTLKKLGVDTLLGSKPSQERSLVLAMIVEQIIHPSSKLGTTRLWHTTTLAQELGVENCSEDDLYRAMDWLVGRQARIEKKLAARHLSQGAQVLYDVSSSYYHGHHCSLAQFGYSRDQKRGKPIVVYGVMTDAQGRPISVQVYPGNTGDPSTVSDQVTKLRERFHLDRITLVGDRGMLTDAQLETLKGYPELGWISCLRFSALRKLADNGHLQLSLFDHQNLAEVSAPEFPGERLIVCKNPLLADERRRKRQELLQATEVEFDKLVAAVNRRTKKPMSAAEIGLKVGRIRQRYKMSKHFDLTIEDNRFDYHRIEQSITREGELDGIYVVRTSEPVERLSAEDAVRSYKGLSKVENLFRTIKGIDRIVRPIRHRCEQRVRAHIFVSMLSYYVTWHMRQSLAPLLFSDDQLQAHSHQRDPVCPACPSEHANHKKKRSSRHGDSDKFPLHSFDTLLAELATRCRNFCRVVSDPQTPVIEILTDLTALQKRVFQLLGLPLT